MVEPRAVIAHAGCGRADVAGRTVVALGPVGVLPSHQGWAEVYFQLCRLAAWDPALTGAFRYAPAFATV